MSFANPDTRVRCSLDQPLQRLMEKLSSKSSELYIFWQNYNQLYSLYSERVTEIETLRFEVQKLRSQPTVSPGEVQIYREREHNLEKQLSDLRLENERIRHRASETEMANHRLTEQNISFQNLIRQFREQNTLQKQNIDNIFARLRESQGAAKTSNEGKFHFQQQVQQLRRSKLALGDLRRQLADKDSQIMLLTASIQDYKREFEKILVEAVRNCKIRLCESLPDIVQASKVTNIQKTSTIVNM